mmetsp:Transcript_9076/g.15334  ORF Transcript_9076/g.15334 Transcript_9076/m.15334 type:complete len:128 (-) Transcript_9076:24-407(-)|eukprot:CAMPEP_0114426870 /NCGR_PEP_ID=MMETSP0103-20121206/8036_1 /TAXON_ID=37642 ORGANISM="Paraphysomonas imperforata, Strain PA2" /NCGR_SAMPLE_ID=MMETSP0103 /ASSEMBLY_ACC=CAM_ASM_000201 /LENGTH=127 /DNA_ID=CAMNT_0001595875 /DNA_START=59 /DNA_END=442 /DNA_ORIENTATION=+
MPVFRKEAARSLIKYVTKLDMKGCIFDSNSKSIFEFARQMNSRHLRKSNPKLDWDFKISPVPACSLNIEFSDGTKWETDPSSFTAGELRDEMLLMAREVEYNYEIKGDNPILGEEEDFTQKGGKKKK